MSAGPWVVVDCEDDTEIRGVSIRLRVTSWTLNSLEVYEEAHRIAERLNKTEGDER